MHSDFPVRYPKTRWCFNSHTCLSWVTSAKDETKRRVIVKPAQLVFLMPLVFCRISCRKPDSLKKVALGLYLHPNSIRFVRCYNLVLSDCWKSDSLGKGCTRNADQHLHHARNLSNPEAKQRTDELRLENIFLNLLPSQPLLRDLHSCVTFQV